MSTAGRNYLQPSPDKIGSYVLKGVWRRYDEQSYQSLKWTLDNFSALLIVACLAFLITLAQSQCWSLVRFIITQYKKSLRLPGDSRPEPLLKLSQGQAISTTIPVLSRWALWLFDRARDFFRVESRYQARPPRSSDDEPVESPFFGLASILNISFFLVMQVAIPYWLTEGSFGSPIVRSKITDECLKFNRTNHFLDILNRETRADEVFHLCQDKLNAGCDSRYHLSKPKITKTRPTTCPFGGDICVNGTASLEITHWNISAFEMGVNSRSKMLMNHRLTCAPISLNPFLWKYKDGSMIYIPRVHLDHPDVRVFGNVSLILATRNGPSKFSDESSGAKMAGEKGPFDLTVLPRFNSGPKFYPGLPPLELNEVLQREDGQSFLVVHRAGASYYSEVIDDPFFSAHNRVYPFPSSPDREMFYPDAEATALGCLEQFQYCFPPSGFPQPCSDWAERNAQFDEVQNYLVSHYKGPYKDNVFAALEGWSDQFGWSVNEMIALFEEVPEKFGIYDYLSLRIGVHGMVPLIQRKTVFEENRWMDDAREQWVLEVEAWFMKAWLSGLLSIQDGALYMLKGYKPGFTGKYMREWGLCGRILFHSKDFTNVNWIGFWVTTSSLTLLCLMGNQVDTIHSTIKRASKGLERWARGRKVLSFSGKQSEWVRKKGAFAINAVRLISQPGTVWNIYSLFQLFSRSRPWYRSGSSGDSSRHSRITATPAATEMDNLESPASTALGRGSQVPSDAEDEFWAIDNPI